MTVGQDDELDRAKLGECVDMAILKRSGIDHDAAFAGRLTQHPGVRAVEGHRPRVGREQSRGVTRDRLKAAHGAVSFG